MRTVKFAGLLLVCASIMVVNGCASGQRYNSLKVQNELQSKRITELSSELKAAELQLEQLQRKLATAEEHGGIELSTLRETVAALEEDLERKKALIASMQQQLLGGARLPVELSTMLEDFAEGEEMVAYDSARGIVKFKSDLLFEPGSDEVKPDAAEAVKKLCGILNSEQGNKFDIIIAGHTDDIPIAKPDTRAKHPTNWHLSVHRAISVLNLMASNKIAPKRMSARGFGEYRPIEPNKPNKKGNPQNRRVEIYIVPEGM